MSAVITENEQDFATPGGAIPDGFGLATKEATTIAQLDTSEIQGTSAIPDPPTRDIEPLIELDAVETPVEAAEAIETAAVDEEEDILEIILPSADPREQKIGDKIYIQKSLSFFKRLQFFREIAKGLKAVVKEGGAEGLSEMLGGAGSSGESIIAELGLQDEGEEASKFIEFAASLADSAPDVLENCYVLWLNIPAGREREWAKAAMRGDLDAVEPLSDEDGVAILKTFVVQNWDAMQDFFGQLREVGTVMQKQQATRLTNRNEE